ncbi:MAG: xanthine dehydrogenase small subunit [Inquilinaceae bacterium]
MANGIRFLLGDRAETVTDIDPTVTVMQWLRARGMTGTKEGCAEGDCGACTVVLGDLDGSDGQERMVYRAVNACIQFVPVLDGRQLLTVEHLKDPDGTLHPVQRAMVDHHGSQCGFCTPGFVMALFARFHDANADPDDREETLDALAGNLCRCTGYRPILDAAAAMACDGRVDRFTAAEPETMAALRGLRRSTPASLTGPRGIYVAPRNLTELAAVLDAAPDATLLAGGTDVGLWVTKQHKRLNPVIYLGGVAELQGIVERDGTIDIGAAVTYAEALPVIARHYPGFGVMLRRLGSDQIRNCGTIGGNIANGSPIGDSMPPLIALGATLVLNGGGDRREMPLEEFFLAYRKTTLRPGEVVERVRFPAADPARHFAVYKVSKRLDQDISAVCAGFSLSLDGGLVSDFRAAFGGMAAVPKRAGLVEAFVVGRPWSLETAVGAMARMDEDFDPMTDMRASRDYRRLVARNLLLRFYEETTGQPSAEAADG